MQQRRIIRIVKTKIIKKMTHKFTLNEEREKKNKKNIISTCNWTIKKVNNIHINDSNVRYISHTKREIE